MPSTITPSTVDNPIAAQHHAIAIVGEGVGHVLIVVNKLPRRALPVVEQVPHTDGVRLADYIIADGVGNIRMAARRRPLFQDLRIAGVVVRIYEENFGLFVCRIAAVKRLVVVRLYADSLVVIGVLGYLINIILAVVVRCNGAFEPVLQSAAAVAVQIHQMCPGQHIAAVEVCRFDSCTLLTLGVICPYHVGGL